MDNENVTQKDSSMWIELQVICPEGTADLLSGYLFEAGAQAVEERAEGEKTVLVTHFPHDDAVDLRISMLTDQLTRIGKTVGKGKAPQVTLKKIKDYNWAEEVRRSYTPVEIVPGIIVRPSWKRARKKRSDIMIEIDPGEAFGTGLHSSTRLCARLMLGGMNLFDEPHVLDVGTGTGILAMIACIRGNGMVSANDTDPKAIEVAGKNFKRNGFTVNLMDTPVEKLKEKYDVIVANLLLEELERIAPDLIRLTQHGSVIVVGGLLISQADQMRQCMEKLGKTEEIRTDTSIDWCSIMFLRK